MERKEDDRAADAGRQEHAQPLARFGQSLESAAQRKRCADNIVIGEHSSVLVFQDRSFSSRLAARPQKRVEQGKARARRIVGSMRHIVLQLRPARMCVIIVSRL
jgi:hypothetical protein